MSSCVAFVCISCLPGSSKSVTTVSWPIAVALSASNVPASSSANLPRHPRRPPRPKHPPAPRPQNLNKPVRIADRSAFICSRSSSLCAEVQKQPLRTTPHDLHLPPAARCCLSDPVQSPRSLAGCRRRHTPSPGKNNLKHPQQRSSFQQIGTCHPPHLCPSSDMRANPRPESSREQILSPIETAPAARSGSVQRGCICHVGEITPNTKTTLPLRRHDRYTPIRSAKQTNKSDQS